MVTMIDSIAHTERNNRRETSDLLMSVCVCVCECTLLSLYRCPEHSLRPGAQLPMCLQGVGTRDGSECGREGRV